MASWARDAVAKLPGVTDVDVRVTFDPPWTPERMKRAR
jgi:metal-sulfur cluster biosynthetic enzyme